MAGQDPIHTISEFTTSISNAKSILDQLNTLIPATIGWVLDEYTPAAPFGAEMYLHTASGFGAEAFFSLKACDDPGSDQSVLLVYANTGYDATKRVDNQPGMWMRHNAIAANAANVVTVFGGGATNGSGDYQTGDTNPLNFAVNQVYTPQAFKTSPLSKLWIVSDPNTSPGKRFIGLIWYLQNCVQVLLMGKVYYDVEAAKTHGQFLTGWSSQFDQIALANLPQNSRVISGMFSSGGGTTGLTTSMFGIIRPWTKNAVQFPTGTATGASLLQVGTAVINEGRLESGGATLQQSVVFRPDMNFAGQGGINADQKLNAALFGPSPRLALHYDTGTGRRMVARLRSISRFPDGGAMVAGSTDWRDASYFFPWYGAPTKLLPPGAIVNNGTRQYMVFPMTSGGSSTDANRRRGLAFRIPNV